MWLPAAFEKPVPHTPHPTTVGLGASVGLQGEALGFERGEGPWLWRVYRGWNATQVIFHDKDSYEKQPI